MTTNVKTAGESGTKTARVAEVTKPQGGLTIVDRPKPEPGAQQVRLRVQACGVCHSDSFCMEGTWPGLSYPLVPGHEIVGIVDEAGPNVVRFKKGDRVGVGWCAGYCGECNPCRSGDFICCERLQIPGINRDGGYAEYAVFPEAVCARVPEKMDSAEAAPLMCAGITTFNALRHSGAIPGDTVAILGLGGLGHLGVQFAAKMGFRAVGIARGGEKADFAKKLGASHYIDSEKSDAVEQLKRLGGAKVILSTVTSSRAVSPWVEALGVNGKLVLVGADIEPLAITPIQLLGQRKSIVGWPSGTGKDAEDCLEFCALTGIRPMIEQFPFAKAKEAYERMMSGKARFRAVIVM